jgi:hypothetical protein
MNVIICKVFQYNLCNKPIFLMHVLVSRADVFGILRIREKIRNVMRQVHT